MNKKKIIYLFAACVILVAVMVLCFEFGGHRTVPTSSKEKTMMASVLSDNTNSTANDIALAITDVSCEADMIETGTIIESETAVPDTFTETPDSENSSDITNSENAIQRFMVGEEVQLPTISTEPKLFTDYRNYSLWHTPHYRLQQAAYTDENGLRRFNEDYIVGLGKFYSESIGDRFQITLDTGVEFTIILGDGKAPCDCDDNNMYTPCINYDGENCANVLEFIVDDDVMPSKVYAYGSIDCLDKFKGDIVKMVYLGRDNSADWDLYEVM